MKQCLIIQNFTALNTMYRKTPPKGVVKQLDDILVDRKHYCSRDADANDLIHIGSDHRSVMAQFVITA